MQPVDARMLAMVRHSPLAIGCTYPYLRQLCLRLTPAPCRSEQAREELSFNAGYLGVHIRYSGNGHLWFRPYGESLGKAPSNQGLLPPSFGASLRLGMPSLRSCSVGPPRPAIHGLTRLTRHPCRVTHYAEPPLGLSKAQKIKSRSKAKARRANARPDHTV
jgi:hypothetical protein